MTSRDTGLTFGPHPAKRQELAGLAVSARADLTHRSSLNHVCSIKAGLQRNGTPGGMTNRPVDNRRNSYPAAWMHMQSMTLQEHDTSPC